MAFVRTCEECGQKIRLLPKPSQACVKCGSKKLDAGHYETPQEAADRKKATEAAFAEIRRAWNQEV